MSDRYLGIDLGTGNIKIYQKSRGIVVQQKNIIAVQKKKDVIAYGDEAYDMFEKAPESIQVTFPMMNGVIADFNFMQQLLYLFVTGKEMKKSMGRKEYFISVPTDITDVEKRAFYDLIAGANIKAKQVYIVEKPIADGLGAGLNVLDAQGVMVVNMGAATTEISVISLGGIVLSKLLHIGGNKLDESICMHVKKNYNLIIGRKTAGELKMKLASAIAGSEDSLKVLGRDIISGLPMEANIQASMVYEAIREYLSSIVDAVKVILERTPPELSADIIDTGIYFTGGSSNIHGLDRLLKEETDLRVNVVEEPSESVVRGLGKIIDEPEFRQLAYPIKQPTYN